MAVDNDTIYTVFERYIGKFDQMDSIYVALKSKADTEMVGCIVSKIEFTESLSTGAPLAIVNFIDAYGDLFNHNPLRTDIDYTFVLGTSPEDSKHFPMRIVDIKSENHAAGKGEKIGFTVTFAGKSWSEMINKTYNRGWASVRISDVVSKIASEVSDKEAYITPTATVQESIVQPNWSNLTFLKWLAERSDNVSATDKGHFEFGVTLEGKFIYASIPDLIRRSLEKNNISAKRNDNRANVPAFKLQGNDLTPAIRKDMVEKNGYVPASFFKFGANNSYMMSILQGSGGITSMYFDTAGGQYNRSAQTFSESYNTQLSDWAMINNEHEQSHLSIYGGRDVLTPIIANNRISNVSNSVQKFKIQADGTAYVSIGDVVELIIPTPVDRSTLPFNEFAGGFYFVSQVHHIIKLNEDTEYATVLTLSRQGFDGKGTETYVKSRKGRAKFNV